MGQGLKIKRSYSLIYAAIASLFVRTIPRAPGINARAIEKLVELPHDWIKAKLSPSSGGSEICRFPPCLSSLPA
jgi:hypothetical protein